LIDDIELARALAASLSSPWWRCRSRGREATPRRAGRLSPETKAREYQATPSVQRYVMLEQDSVGAVAYARSGDGWTHEILVEDSVLALPAIGVELPLAELYEGIVFDDAAGWRVFGDLAPAGSHGGMPVGRKTGARLGFVGNRTTISAASHAALASARPFRSPGGLDEWASRKGLRFGNIAVDLELGQ
jgi:hypothetical protein